MKDFYNIWNRLFGKTYGAVQTGDYGRDAENTQDETWISRRNEYRKRAFTYTFLGIGALLSGIFIMVVDPYNLLYEWKLVFGKGGEIYSLWENPPVALYLKVYLWNITNKEEYMSGKDKKLKFQEIGPYVYRELMTHENVTFNDNGTLTTNPSHPLVWVPELSEGRREDDLLILPNIALLSIADVASKKGLFTRLGLNVVIRQTKSEPLVKMTAREFMFGYKSTLMTLGNTFMNSWIYFDKLGLIDRMYEFSGDYETFYTGQKDGIKNIGLLDKYNGQIRIPQWESPCGDVTGASDGTKFPGNIQPDEKLLFFRKSMCRAKELVRVNETVVDGLRAYVYHFANDTDDNGRLRPKNRCFCKESDIDKCLPNGLLDVRGCYYGFPIALSYPHFLDGDKSLMAKVESGLNPDPEKHKSYFVIQPDSGLPINLAVRYQINMALGNLENIANSEKFTDMILPLLWTENGMYGLPPSLSLRFKLYISILPVVQSCLKYASFLGSVVLLVCAVRKFVLSKRGTDAGRSPWIEDSFVTNIERKLSGYIPEKRDSMSARELKMYVEKLMVPLNQKIITRDDE